jgi:hypothetical protein
MRRLTGTDANLRAHESSDAKESAIRRYASSIHERTPGQGNAASKQLATESGNPRVSNRPNTNPTSP